MTRPSPRKVGKALPKRSFAWAVYSISGINIPSLTRHTRRLAIEAVQAISGDDWPRMYRAGNRVRRVELVPSPPLPRKAKGARRVK